MAKLIKVQPITIEELGDRNIFKEGRPVVLKGACKNWPASKKWSADFFTKNYGDKSVPLSNYREDPYQLANTKPSILIKDYLSDIKDMMDGKYTGSEDLYSAGWNFTKNEKELLEDLDIPKMFQNNWAEKVQDVLYFDTTALLFGHPKVESPTHTDSFFVSTWIASIIGQKGIRLVEPKHTAHIKNGDNLYDESKVEELLSKDIQIFDCVVSEGDIVWFPPGWWHHVKNDSFTASVTVNYVDSHHFLPFEQQIRSTLLKPLLGLNKLKNDAISKTVKEEGSLEGLEYSQENIQDSNYVELETKYINHFMSEANKTSKLLKHLQL